MVVIFPLSSLLSISSPLTKSDFQKKITDVPKNDKMRDFPKPLTHHPFLDFLLTCQEDLSALSLSENLIGMSEETGG